ncbi:MAG: acyl-CoA dehydrogenase family protein [Desulfobacterales bacterium]
MSAGFQMSNETKMLQTWVREYVRKEILPLETTMDPEAITISTEDYERLSSKTREAGMWHLGLPEKYGGAGLDCFTMTVLMEEMSQHRNGLYNTCYGTLGRGVPNIIFSGTEEQIEKYAIPTLNGERTGSFFAITEPTGGSDPARAIQTTAVLRGDQWVLNGTKVFISGAGTADWGIIFARTGEGRGGISAFIVETDTPGFKTSPIYVLRPSYPYEISLMDCRIPRENLLGEEGKGFELVTRLLGVSRFPYSAANLGVAVAAHRMAVDYAKKREVFGRTLSEKQGIQWMLADSEVDIRSTRWLIWEGAWKVDRGEDYRQEASIAKLVSSEVLGRVVDRAVQIHGAYGVSKELPLERWYREARIRRIGEGPSEVHRFVIARNLLR